MATNCDWTILPPAACRAGWSRLTPSTSSVAAAHSQRPTACRRAPRAATASPGSLRRRGRGHCRRTAQGVCLRPGPAASEARTPNTWGCAATAVTARPNSQQAGLHGGRAANASRRNRGGSCGCNARAPTPAPPTRAPSRGCKLQPSLGHAWATALRPRAGRPTGGRRGTRPRWGQGMQGNAGARASAKPCQGSRGTSQSAAGRRSQGLPRRDSSPLASRTAARRCPGCAPTKGLRSGGSRCGHAPAAACRARGGGSRSRHSCSTCRRLPCAPA
mmetsp:Transcript_106087/g.330902  ORF Transcript_106087/g.330902 Transcript_106087/m.330902 type:complete len:274 (+) Transcript_106087:140-961(+)